MRLLCLAVLAASPFTARAADPLLPPPSQAEHWALLTAEGAAAHLSVHLVDDRCLKGSLPSVLGMSLREAGTLGNEERTLSLDFPTSTPFEALQEAAQAAAKKVPKRKAGFGLDWWAGKVSGLRALCLVTPAVLPRGLERSAGEPNSVEVSLSAAQLKALKKLPKSALRVAFVYDGSLVVHVERLSDLRNLDAPAKVQLMEAPSP